MAGLSSPARAEFTPLTLNNMKYIISICNISLRTIPPSPGVYEYVTDEATGRRRLSINAHNCLHCKVGWELLT